MRSQWLSQEQYLVRETADDYREAVLPFIRAIPPERNAWIDNILQTDGRGHKAAAAETALLLEDADFVLMNDAKWDGSTVHQLHCLGTYVLNKQSKAPVCVC